MLLRSAGQGGEAQPVSAGRSDLCLPFPPRAPRAIPGTHVLPPSCVRVRGSRRSECQRALGHALTPRGCSQSRRCPLGPWAGSSPLEARRTPAGPQGVPAEPSRSRRAHGSKSPHAEERQRVGRTRDVPPPRCSGQAGASLLQGWRQTVCFWAWKDPSWVNCPVSLQQGGALGRAG